MRRYMRTSRLIPPPTTAAPATPRVRFTAWQWWALAALLGMAFALRLYRLDAVPLRGDEAFTAIHWTKTPFSPDWNFMIQHEPNPGAMLAYWAWSSAVGTSELALRMLAVLANVFGLAVAVALARRLRLTVGAALAVGLLWALNPFFLWHAQDARQYSLLTALTALNVYLLLRAVEGERPRLWWVYVAAQTATLYLYYIEAFWVAAQGVYLLSLRRGAVLRRYVACWCVIALLLIPLAVQFYVVLSVSGYSGTAQRAALADLFAVFLPTLLFGESTLPVLVGLGLALALITGLARGRQTLLLAWVLVPTTLFYIASTQLDLFRPRYIIAVAPALLIAIVWSVWRWLPARTNRAAVILAVCVVSAWQCWAYFFVVPAKSPPWDDLAHYLRPRTTTASVVISDSADTALEYYYPAPGTIYFVPTDRDPTEADFAALLAGRDALFVLSGARTGALSQYLQANAQAIPGDTLPGLVQFRPWTVTAGEIAAPLAVRIADVAVLRGWTLVGDTTLLLYWEAVRQTPQEHSVLLHLYAPGTTAPAAVLDHGIAGAIISTRAWIPGGLYRDPVALPPNLPAGEYAVRVGLYETATGEPLRIAGTSAEQYTLVGLRVP